MNNKVEVGETYKNVCLLDLEDGYYFVNGAQLQKDDFGMSFQRTVIRKDHPACIFFASEEYEECKNIKGTFTKLNVINNDL